MPTPNPLLTQARAYTEKYGWAIVPVIGKQAATNWKKYQTNRPSDRQLIGLFSARPATGLAVLVGGVSDGLRVRDFDRADSYHAWAAAHPDLAVTLPTSKTARGYHVFFRADVPERMVKYEDGEFRAGNCYVVLPPSKHPDGDNYAWVVPPAEAIPFVPDVAGAGLLGTPVVTSAVPPEVEAVIGRTLPTAYGQRTSRLWEFARRLKGIPELDTSAEALLSYVREWHRRALPHIRTKSLAKTELAFYDAWTNAVVPLTDDQFLTWVRPFLAGPDPEWLKAKFFPPLGKRLLRLCAALQERVGAGPFYLAARPAASAIGADPTHTCELFKRLVKAGYLEMVEKGTYGTGMATTWRYLGPAR